MNPHTDNEAAADTELLDYLFDLRGYVILRGAAEADLVADLNRVLDEFPPLEFQEWHGNVQRFDNHGVVGTELQNIVEAGEPFERLIDHPSWLPHAQRWCGDLGSYTQGVFIDECFASIRRSGGFSQSIRAAFRDRRAGSIAITTARFAAVRSTCCSP